MLALLSPPGASAFHVPSVKPRATYKALCSSEISLPSQWLRSSPSSLEDPPDYLCLGRDPGPAVSLDMLPFNLKVTPTVKSLGRHLSL